MLLPITLLTIVLGLTFVLIVYTTQKKPAIKNQTVYSDAGIRYYENKSYILIVRINDILYYHGGSMENDIQISEFRFTPHISDAYTHRSEVSVQSKLKTLKEFILINQPDKQLNLTVTCWMTEKDRNLICDEIYQRSLK
jgi:hypothetical protein